MKKVRIIGNEDGEVVVQDHVGMLDDGFVWKKVMENDDSVIKVMKLIS